MKTLYIDTHYKNVCIALYNDEILIRKEEVSDKQNNSEFIFPAIVKVLNDEKFDEIVVINGPGSFTGVRLGVTIAKTFAYTLNIPIKTITALKAIAISNNALKVAIFDNNGYFVGSFDNSFNENDDYKYINKEDFDNDGFLVDGLINTDLVIKYMKNVEPTDSHMVNPIYVKKIGVEID